jgi:hypothetical protein
LRLQTLEKIGIVKGDAPSSLHATRSRLLLLLGTESYAHAFCTWQTMSACNNNHAVPFDPVASLQINRVACDLTRGGVRDVQKISTAFRLRDCFSSLGIKLIEQLLDCQSCF